MTQVPTLNTSFNITSILYFYKTILKTIIFSTNMLITTLRRNYTHSNFELCAYKFSEKLSTK